MNIISVADRLFDRLLGLLVILSGILICFLMVSVSLEVGLRYFLGRPTSWVIEVAGYTVLLIPFFVAPWVLKRQGHVKMDFVLSRVNPGTQALLNTATALVSAVICLVLTCFGVRSTLYFLKAGYKTPTVLMLPKYIFISLIAFGTLLLFIQCLRNAYGFYSTYRTINKNRKLGSEVSSLTL